MERPKDIPDWQVATAYADLHQVEGAGLAWEWLRRRFDYVAASRAGTIVPQAFGLERYEDPGLGAVRARPLWTAAMHPFVVRAFATPAVSGPDALDLAHHRALAIVVGGFEVTHVLLSDGYRSIRLDLNGAVSLNQPVQLQFAIRGLDSARPQLLTLRRLIHLCANGSFAKSLHPKEPRSARQVLLLRAFDAVQAGATQREIAARLLDSAAAGIGWRIEAPSLRSQAQRLVRDARRMAAGAYLALLR